MNDVLAILFVNKCHQIFKTDQIYITFIFVKKIEERNILNYISVNVFVLYLTFYPCPKIIKLFSCSSQLSMKFQLLIKAKMLKNKDFSCFYIMAWCCLSAC